MVELGNPDKLSEHNYNSQRLASYISRQMAYSIKNILEEKKLPYDVKVMNPGLGDRAVYIEIPKKERIIVLSPTIQRPTNEGKYHFSLNVSIEQFGGGARTIFDKELEGLLANPNDLDRELDLMVTQDVKNSLLQIRNTSRGFKRLESERNGDSIIMKGTIKMPYIKASKNRQAFYDTMVRLALKHTMPTK